MDTVAIKFAVNTKVLLKQSTAQAETCAPYGGTGMGQKKAYNICGTIKRRLTAKLAQPRCDSFPANANLHVDKFETYAKAMTRLK